MDTIAGYIMKRLGRVTRVGDAIDIPYGTIRVENMAQVRITQGYYPHSNANTRGTSRLTSVATREYLQRDGFASLLLSVRARFMRTRQDGGRRWQ